VRPEGRLAPAGPLPEAAHDVERTVLAAVGEGCTFAELRGRADLRSLGERPRRLGLFETPTWAIVWLPRLLIAAAMAYVAVRLVHGMGAWSLPAWLFFGRGGLVAALGLLVFMDNDAWGPRSWIGSDRPEPRRERLLDALRRRAPEPGSPLGVALYGVPDAPELADLRRLVAPPPPSTTPASRNDSEDRSWGIGDTGGGGSFDAGGFQ
jgi:hypothetical protein